MPEPVQLLIAVLVPALATAVVLCVFLAFRRGSEERLAGAGAAGIGAGYLAGHIAVRGVPSFPPGESADWICWLALAAALAGFGETRLKPGSPLRIIGKLLISAAVPVCLLWRPIHESFETWQSFILAPALTGGVFFLWVSIEKLARRREGIFYPVLVFFSVVPASVGVLLSGSLVLARLGGALSASLGASLPFVAFRSRGGILVGGAGAMAVVYSALLINGHFLAYLPWTSALLYFISPIAPWIAQTKFAARLSPTRRRLGEALSVLLPVAAAVALAFAASPSFEG